MLINKQETRMICSHVSCFIRVLIAKQLWKGLYFFIGFLRADRIKAETTVPATRAKI